MSAPRSSFFLVWSGQVVSLFGSALTAFALSIWVFDQTGSSQALATVTFCKFLPLIYLSMVAGPIVDRVDRKKLLLTTNSGLALVSAVLLFLVTRRDTNLWGLYGTIFVSGVFESIQALTFRTTISMFVRREKYTKYNGLIAMMQSLPFVVAPFAAAFFLSLISIIGILVIDICTFGLSIGALLLVAFPKIPPANIKKILDKTTLHSGLRYIWTRQPLFKFQTLFTFANFTNGLLAGILVAYILVRTGGSVNSAALVTALGAMGGILGGFFASSFRISSRKVPVILLGMALYGLLGRVTLPFLEGMVFLGGMLLLRSMLNTLINAQVETIWQSKVSPEMQGRVFGARRVFAQGLYPIALILGGFLSEHVFTDERVGSLSFLTDLGFVSEAVGMSMMFFLIGIMECLIPLYCLFSRDIIEVEERVPDHSFVPSVAGQ